MKNLFFIFVIFSAFLFASCSGSKSSIAMGELDGVCFPNKTCNEGLTCDEESNLCVKIELPDDSDSTADTDSEDTDTDNETPTEDTDTTTDTTPEENTDADQGRKQGELYGECYPNNTCNEGLICDVENNICIKDPDAQNDDDSDTMPDDDTDIVVELTEEEKCLAAEGSWNEAESSCTKAVDCADKPEHSEWNGNSAYTLEYINGEWTETIETEYNEEVGTCRFKCEEHYFWNGYICVNPCDNNPCLQVTNSNEECTGIDAAVFSCGCLEHYTWTTSTLTCDADSQLMECSDIPENATYNSVSAISQTWNGEDWFPSNESSFSETPSETECRFKCDPEYVWTGSMCKLPTPCDSNPCTDVTNSTEECSLTDGNYVCGCIEHYYWTGSLCEAEQQVKPCTGKPENSSWNTAESITQTWNGTDWDPSTTGVYNTTASTSECRYKCNTNYSWNSSNSTCVVTTQQGNCSSKPANTVWNDNGKNGKFDQTWNGSAYTPASYTSTYDTTAGTCRYKCSSEYFWNGSACKKQYSLGNICTGQTKCYNDSGEITCPTAASAAFFGQDAQYTSKCTPQSFTIQTISGQNIVVDNNTGLIWQQTISTTKQNWSNAGSYCSALIYAGYSDWRVPTPQELLTIVDNSKYKPATNTTYFPKTPSSDDAIFWSSSTQVNDTSKAWELVISSGKATYYYKTNSDYVRCVRGKSLPSSSFNSMTVNDDVIVTDTKTGLVWQKTCDTINTKTWQHALDYCENLTYAGYSDWRLPNKNELASLINYEKYNMASDFPDMPGNEYFWSSSTLVDNKDTAWHINFLSGSMDSFHKTYTSYVRCVRNAD